VIVLSEESWKFQRVKGMKARVWKFAVGGLDDTLSINKGLKILRTKRIEKLELACCW